jgi:hypothetical protein
MLGKNEIRSREDASAFAEARAASANQKNTLTGPGGVRIRLHQPPGKQHGGFPNNQNAIGTRNQFPKAGRNAKGEFQ